MTIGDTTDEQTLIRVLALRSGDREVDRYTKVVDALPAEGFEVFRLSVPRLALNRSGSVQPIDIGQILGTVPADIVFGLLPDEPPSAIKPLAARRPLVVVGTTPKMSLSMLEAGAQEFLSVDELNSAAVARVLRKSLVRHRRRSAARLTSTALQELLEVDAEGWLIVSPAGQILFANMPAQQLLGQSLAELIGQNFGVPSRTGSMEIDIVRRTQHGHQTAILDVRVVEIDWRGQPAFLELLRDITDYQRQLRGTRDAIRQRDRFLATLSHELRNPLAAISTGTTLLAEDNVDETTRRETLDLIERQVRCMSRLIDDLLDFSRIGQGRIALDLQETRLSEVLQHSLKMMRGRFAAKRQQLSVDLGAVDPICAIDQQRVQQIIVNLLTNASKFTPANGRVSVTMHAGDQKAEVVVSDNGEGIASSMLESIFEPFVQLRQSAGAAEDGLGIGLALARKLAEHHGGALRAESSGPGEGAVFTLALPMRATQPLETQVPHQAASAAQSPAECDALTTVVVEDYHPNRVITCTLLRAMGNVVYEAVDGRQGLEKIDEVRPDLSLIDIGLPELTGYEVAQQLRLRENGQRLFLVALSGYGEENDKKMSAQAGFDLHVTKPITKEAIQQLLDQARQRRTRMNGR